MHATTKGIEPAVILEEARTAFALGLLVDTEAVLTVCDQIIRERDEAVADLAAERDAVDDLLKALDDFANTLQEEVDDGMKLTRKAAQSLRKAQDFHDKAYDATEFRR